MSLKLESCSYEAAKWAVEHFHYSRRMPRSKLARFGVWEDGKFIGVVLYGYGATPTTAKHWSLKQVEIVELVRVALSRHIIPTSKIVSVSLRLLRRSCPGIRMVYSYADTKEGHIGTIYQASGWTYDGVSDGSSGYFLINGRIFHARTIISTGRSAIAYLKEKCDPNAKPVRMPPKHRYLWFFDQSLREKFDQMLPYPKRATSETGDTSPLYQGEEGGSTPTVALV